MSDTLMSSRLVLVPATPEQLLAKWQGPDGVFAAEISPAWIDKLRVARGPDPWVLGYMVVHRESNAPIGGGGFRGEPGAGGIVEIAYGIDEQFQGQGYATETAQALVAFAFADPRVLDKCGFTRVPDVIDPEDGLVWRFEKPR
jgi:RimJ/RimL family protein N-acetyltransferase